MNRGIYGAASGMLANQQWLDVVANNLANVNTVGFKRDGIVFHDWIERSMFANGGTGHEIGSLGAGPAPTKLFTNWSKGTMATTDNPLDVAVISEKGLYAIELPPSPNVEGRNIVYTRDGAFQLGPDGRLNTREGYAVLDTNREPIYLDHTKPATIDETGNVGPLLGGEGNQRIGLFDGPFRKLGFGLYSSPTAELYDQGRVQQRALEGSNVNTVETMIQMITVSRAFEMGQKAISTQDDSNGKLLDMLRGT
jgi:flagellar basal-body rod protein FlgF